MSVIATAGIVLEVLSVGLAAGLAVVGVRAYHRTGAALFRRASVGFALVAVGLLSESVVMRWTPFSLPEAHFAESLFLLAGLSVLYLSLRLSPQ